MWFLLDITDTWEIIYVGLTLSWVPLVRTFSNTFRNKNPLDFFKNVFFTRICCLDLNENVPTPGDIEFYTYITVDCF